MTTEQTISPVEWMQHPTRSKWLTRVLRPKQPAVLVISLPRSGSSWAGEALGCAIDALYLREPVTQSDHTFYDLGTVFAIDTPDRDARYRRHADKAYAGWPDFAEPSIVRFPEQWALSQRRSRRVVVKEVNPLACDWYIQHYAPRIVFLVRHPGAVALSWQRNGWLGVDAESWAKNGAVQGHALREALSVLEKYAAQRIVVYEELCADPIKLFRPMFDFAGLTWDAHAEQFIAERTRKDDGSNTWNTSRNSQAMIHGWRKHAVQAHVSALRKTFGEYDVPWYREDEDWVV